MYKYHRLEYYNHRKSKIALLLTTYVSIMILFGLIVCAFYTSICMAAHEEWHKDSPEAAAFYDLDDKQLPQVGICTFYVGEWLREAESEYNKRNMSLIYFGMTLLELIPFLAFFIFNRPHDCFICLGKDPERIYSSLQLTTQEQESRRMWVKYSMGREEAL